MPEPIRPTIGFLDSTIQALVSLYQAARFLLFIMDFIAKWKWEFFIWL